MSCLTQLVLLIIFIHRTLLWISHPVCFLIILFCILPFQLLSVSSLLHSVPVVVSAVFYNQTCKVKIFSLPVAPNFISIIIPIRLCPSLWTPNVAFWLFWRWSNRVGRPLSAQMFPSKFCKLHVNFLRAVKTLLAHLNLNCKLRT